MDEQEKKRQQEAVDRAIELNRRRFKAATLEERIEQEIARIKRENKTDNANKVFLIAKNKYQTAVRWANASNATQKDQDKVDLHKAVYEKLLGDLDEDDLLNQIVGEEPEEIEPVPAPQPKPQPKLASPTPPPKRKNYRPKKSRKPYRKKPQQNQEPKQLPADRSLALIADSAHVSADMKRTIMAKMKAAERTGELMWWGVVGGILFLTVLIFLTGSAAFGLLLLMIIGMLFIVPFKLAYGRKGNVFDWIAQSNAEQQFQCPECHQWFNLADWWTCSNCSTVHKNQNLSFVTPIHGCDNSSCNRQEQAAMQCPECHQHIILNQTLYDQSNSNQKPYPRVARYVRDGEQPVFPIDEEPGYFD